MEAMEPADLDTAIALARAEVGAELNVPADARRVRRLDRDGSYVLVQLGRVGEPGWLAAVDPRTWEVMTWAVNTSGNATFPALPQTLNDVTSAELVWRPSDKSRSPLYPLLQLTTSSGEVYVDISGKIWTALSDGHG